MLVVGTQPQAVRFGFKTLVLTGGSGRLPLFPPAFSKLDSRLVDASLPLQLGGGTRKLQSTIHP